MKKNIMFLIFFIFFKLSLSQTNNLDNNIYNGNKFYEKKEFINSESNYRKSISLDENKTTGYYNLGNTHYRAEDFEAASQRFFQSQKSSNSKIDKHKAFHNMGNTFMKKKEYEKAVEAYKNALRNNSFDDESRYNYALAKELFEKEKKKKEKNKNDKDNNDKKDDEKKKDKYDKNKKDKDDKNKKDKDKNDKNKKDKDKNDKKDDENKKDDKNKKTKRIKENLLVNKENYLLSKLEAY